MLRTSRYVARRNTIGTACTILSAASSAIGCAASDGSSRDEESGATTPPADVSSDSSLHVVATVSFPNGIALDPSGRTLYFNTHKGVMRGANVDRW